MTTVVALQTTFHLRHSHHLHHVVDHPVHVAGLAILLTNVPVYALLPIINGGEEYPAKNESHHVDQDCNGSMKTRNCFLVERIFPLLSPVVDIRGSISK